MTTKAPRFALCAVFVAALSACGGGGGGDAGGTATAQSAKLQVLMSDASSEDWATIGVKVLSIALVPQGGAAPVTVYTAPSAAPVVNLAQLDQLGELIGDVSIPAGTYTSATVTISANPGDVLLTTSADPEPGFAAAASTTIPSSQIQIQGARGAAGSKTVPVQIGFAMPLVVSATQSNALDLEFDLAHPAFIVAHDSPLAGSTIWAVNFNGPLRHHPIERLADLVLRHSYGTVSAVSADNTAITFDKVLPTLPVQTPETAASTGQSLSVQADATNGTLFYDLDAKTSVTIKDFSTVGAALPGKFVRVAARYQQDGTLTATRIWSSSSFNTVWVSPEGHVTHVDAANGRFTVSDESGRPVALGVGADTKFYFRSPSSGLADATPIGTGTAFLTAKNLVRGFKVHVQVADPLATPLIAQSVDIETAAYDGRISAATTSGFTYTRKFATATDNYVQTLPYIAAGSANGKDSSGAAITGFKFWNFAYPTLVTSGAAATTAFASATNGSANFGGTVGALAAYGATYARWGDAANPTGWSAPWTVLAPTAVPRGNVTAPLSSGAFQFSVPGGTTPVVTNVSSTPGSATLVYQVDRTNGVVTISPQDITTSTGLAALTQGLVVGASVKVDAVPQADGSLKAYVLAYFTGDLPQ